MTMFAIKNIAAQALLACLAGTFGLTGAARAHIVLEYQVAPAGSSYKATFKVGHGCGTSPTRQISVQVPAGVRGARPMPKPGWALEVQRAPLPQPYASHGRSVADDVTRITWTARTPDDMLPNAHYDEFVLVGQLPDRPGPLYWPVSQVCEAGRTDWTEVPAPGQDASALKSPAALLDVLPAGGGSGAHQH